MSISVSAISTAPPPTMDQRVHLATQNQGQSQSQQEPRPPVSMDTVIAELSNVSAAFSKRLSFQLNEKLGQVVVKVIDTETDTVIRELPPEELQNVHERIREVMGILFDERA